MERPPQPEAEALRGTVQSFTDELISVLDELGLLRSLRAKIGWLADEAKIASVALQEAYKTLPADCGWVVLWEGQESSVPESCRIKIDADTIERINHGVLESLYRRGKREVLFNDL